MLDAVYSFGHGNGWEPEKEAWSEDREPVGSSPSLLLPYWIGGMSKEGRWAVPFHYRKSSTQGALETVLILRIKKAAMRKWLLLLGRA